MSSPVLKTLEQSFTQVEVRESPVKSTPQRGNLTGNPRKIRDSAADLFNLIQEWKNENVKGYDTLVKINSLKITSLSEGDADPEKVYPEGLQLLCDELDTTCTSLKEVIGRMAISRTEVGAVVKLEALRQNDAPLFLTWPTQRFGEVWTEITEAFEEELKLKVYIKENIAHVTSDASFMFLLASWAHQPYLPASVDLALETLLKETSHR